MAQVDCPRCHSTREGLAGAPFRNEIGQRLLASVCGVCWQDWLKHQQALINHYALDLRDAKARDFLFTEVESFFFGSGESP